MGSALTIAVASGATASPAPAATTSASANLIAAEAAGSAHASQPAAHRRELGLHATPARP